MDPSPKIDEVAHVYVDKIQALAIKISQDMSDEDLVQVDVPKDVMGMEFTLSIFKSEIKEFIDLTEIGYGCISAYMM